MPYLQPTGTENYQLERKNDFNRAQKNMSKITKHKNGNLERISEMSSEESKVKQDFYIQKRKSQKISKERTEIPKVKVTIVSKNMTNKPTGTPVLNKKKFLTFQICEIEDPNVQAFVSDFLTQNKDTLVFDSLTGWFTKEAFRNLIKLIKISF